jgi:hypothetical protein
LGDCVPELTPFLTCAVSSTRHLFQPKIPLRSMGSRRKSDFAIKLTIAAMQLIVVAASPCRECSSNALRGRGVAAGGWASIVKPGHNWEMMMLHLWGIGGRSEQKDASTSPW